MSALVDRYGRVHTDLRVSLTDKCNLRCTYCMPAEGLEWLPSPDLLHDDEVVRVVDVAVRLLGITDVWLTSREPMLRSAIVHLSSRLAPRGAPPRPPMPTNRRRRAPSAAA